MKNKSDKEVQDIRLDCIIPNRFQPRKTLDKESLRELIDSISTHGVLEPIVVRQISQSASQPVGQSATGPEDRKTGRPPTYEIIMGERRFRACQALQKETIPAVVKEADDRQMMEWTLIENTHRKDLNPMERAKAYKRLADTFHLTHEEVAQRVGVNRAVVSNFIRLLGLPAEIQEDVGRQTITVGHAIALLAIPDSLRRLMVWRRVKNEDLSVRNLRILVDAYLHPRGVAISHGRNRPPMFKEWRSDNDPNIRELEQRLNQKFRAPVNITIFKLQDELRSGVLAISFHSEEEYQYILKIMNQ